MTDNSVVWVPFEMTPCHEHGWACGGDANPRHDLPVFRDQNAILPWMTSTENNHVHFRDGEPVRLVWMEHTQDEATVLGFPPPKEGMH